MEKLLEDIWVHGDSFKIGPVDGTIRMTVVRLTEDGSEGGSEGKLWIHSPTPISAELKRQIDELGSVEALVAPNNGHNLFYMEWVMAYPSAARFVARRIPEKLPTLGHYEVLSNAAANPWPNDFDLEVMDGVPFFDECAFLHRSSKSLILTDFVQDHREEHTNGVSRLMMKLVMGPIGFKDICLAPPLKMGFMIKNRRLLTDFVHKVLDWEFDRIIVTHGQILDAESVGEDPKKLLARLCQRFE